VREFSAARVEECGIEIFGVERMSGREAMRVFLVGGAGCIVRSRRFLDDDRAAVRAPGALLRSSSWASTGVRRGFGCPEPDRSARHLSVL